MNRSFKVNIINFIAELAGAVLFSFLCFLFLSRTAQGSFEISAVQLAASIALCFFASVYLPFSTNRIHVLPVITLLASIKRRSYTLFLFKTSAQVLGAVLGCLLFFQYSLWNGELIAVADYYLELEFVSNTEAFAFNFLVSFALASCYYYIRYYSRQDYPYGVVFLSVLMGVFFFYFANYQSFSAFNIYGLLAYSLLETNVLFSGEIIFDFLVHIISFIFGALLVVLLFSKRQKTRNSALRN